MKGDNVDFGGAVTGLNIIRVKVTDMGDIILDVMNRYGSSNHVEYLMNGASAGLLADRLSLAYENAERIAGVYSELRAQEKAQIMELRQDGSW